LSDSPAELIDVEISGGIDGNAIREEETVRGCLPPIHVVRRAVSGDRRNDAARRDLTRSVVLRVCNVGIPRAVQRYIERSIQRRAGCLPVVAAVARGSVFGERVNRPSVFTLKTLCDVDAEI